jgi:O-antigen ligase
MLVGYCLMGRSFAYLGIPPWHLFIGEIVLAMFLWAGPRTSLGAWTKVAFKIRPIAGPAKAFLILFAYGILEVVHGIAAGYPPLTAARDLAFNYYPVFFLLGMWVGFRKPDFLPRLFRWLAWFNAVYGLAYILFLDRSKWIFPGVSREVADVSIFGAPEFSFVVLLGLLAYEKDLFRVSHLLLLNTFVLLAMQVRAEWLALGIGLFLWGLLTKRLKRMAGAAAVVVLLLAAMYAIDFKMAGPESRGGADISARDLIGRAFAPIDANLASKYTSSYEMDEGTTVWRLVWWAAIWEQVHESRVTSLVGLGYGYALGDLVPYLQGEFIQTPHNVFFYTLGYTGWIGVLLFAYFQAQLVYLLWKGHRKTRQPSGLILWIAMMVFALFTPFFEVPQGAIPFYVFLGCVAGAAFLQTALQSQTGNIQARTQVQG